MAKAPRACAGLDAKHYTLAALAATLVVAAVVTVVSVALSPARISFSVEARKDFRSDPARLVLTLAAHNPSRRAWVRYHGIFVDVSNDSSTFGTSNWISADVSAHLPLDQPRRNETKLNATVVELGDAEGFITSNKRSTIPPPSVKVMVTAVVRFKQVGVKWTSLYEIKFSCGDLYSFPFFYNVSTRADCPQLVDT